MIVVSDTSPITSLPAVGQLHLLQQLYNSIIIPQAVYDEMTSLDYPVPGAVEVQTLPWIQTRQVTNLVLVRQFQTELDEGESEAIALALELQADLLVIDEYPARKVASRLGLNIVGVLGVFLNAKRRSLIPTVKPVMDDLIVQANFRIGEQLYADILQFAGE
ncbi:MAG: DUF3368 domain-containing protein [Cyanobacteriota bacterium]|nr:DUF3368 domain-containing protein [Cyanobacteriota bacterium]